MLRVFVSEQCQWKKHFPNNNHLGLRPLVLDDPRLILDFARMIHAPINIYKMYSLAAS